MFCNILITFINNFLLCTDCFRFDSKKHTLTYHSNLEDDWVTLSNVDCDIKVDRPMVYVNVKDL